MCGHFFNPCVCVYGHTCMWLLCLQICTCMWRSNLPRSLHTLFIETVFHLNPEFARLPCGSLVSAFQMLELQEGSATPIQHLHGLQGSKLWSLRVLQILCSLSHHMNRVCVCVCVWRRKQETIIMLLSALMILGIT